MQQVVEYNVTDATISEMKAQFMPLVVKDLQDTRGLAEVHRARMIVKSKRVEVEKRRKELKADALSWGQKVDAEARRIVALLEPIEDHLQKEEDKITKERERVKKEEERMKHETALARVNALAKFGVHCPYENALTMTPGEFDSRIIIAEYEYKEEQERVEAERKERESESKRLEAERAELERKQAEMKAAQDKLDTDRRAVEDAKREQERQAEIERAKKEAAERALKEAAEKAEREQREKEAAEAKARAEAERKEALRPDKEKLVSYAARLMATTDPDLKSPEAKSIFSAAYKKLLTVNQFIANEAGKL